MTKSKVDLMGKPEAQEPLVKLEADTMNMLALCSIKAILPHQNLSDKYVVDFLENAQSTEAGRRIPEPPRFWKLEPALRAQGPVAAP